MTLVFFICLYIACQLIADVTAVKVVELWGIALPAGTFVYAATFTLRDAIHKRGGKKMASMTVLFAAITNVIMALYFTLAIKLPPAVWWPGQEPFQAVLGSVGYIVAASIVAELFAELLDTELYHIAANSFARESPALRVLFSNVIAVPLDSIVFAGLAFLVLPPLFGQVAYPVAAVISIIWGQTLFKWALAIITIPLGIGGKMDLAVVK